MPPDNLIDRSRFLEILAEHFPQFVETLSDIDDGLIHLKVAAFRRYVEVAIDDERLWDVERCFRFVNEILPQATSSLKNALEISFIEDFALGEFTELRHLAVKERAPKTLREKIVAVNERWR